MEALLVRISPEFALAAGVTLGRIGERIAERECSLRGMSLARRNWRGYSGEIDLIFVHGKEVVFVEVKSRTNTNSTITNSDERDLFQAITRTKRDRLRRLCFEFLNEELFAGQDVPFRIDAVGVLFSATQPLRVLQIDYLKAAI